MYLLIRGLRKPSSMTVLFQYIDVLTCPPVTCDPIL